MQKNVDLRDFSYHIGNHNQLMYVADNFKINSTII